MSSADSCVFLRRIPFVVKNAAPRAIIYVVGVDGREQISCVGWRGRYTALFVAK